MEMQKALSATGVDYLREEGEAGGGGRRREEAGGGGGKETLQSISFKKVERG